MQLSLIVPLFNCLELTRAMVASLQATLPAGLSHEIILVDDGSTDGTRDWLQTLGAPFRVVLNERNLGYAASNNRGAALAGGEILALLNNDLVLTPRWLEPMLAVERRLGPQAGLVGNVQRTFSEAAIDHTGIFINRKGKPEHDRHLPWTCWIPGLDWKRVDALTGACALIRRRLWSELGGFDERYFNGCEDVDLCFRAAAAGRVNAVALRSVVRHHVSASPGRKRKDEENTFKLTQRWRETLVRLGLRRWCVDQLETLQCGDADAEAQAATWSAFLYAYGLQPSPSSELLARMDAAIEGEVARWREILAT
jgi:GT2 family glycosyltransferase